jgi:hypothetical protein
MLVVFCVQSHTASEHVDMSRMSRSERNRARQVVLDFNIAGSRSSGRGGREGGGRDFRSDSGRRREPEPPRAGM